MNFKEVRPFVEIPYDSESFDCADFVRLVQKELFDRDVAMPFRRPRGVRGQVALKGLSEEVATRVEKPEDGDLVLMRDFGTKVPGHAGVYLHLAHEGWVLHCNDNPGQSVCHRLRDLPEFKLQVEGFYRWK